MSAGGSFLAGAGFVQALWSNFRDACLTYWNTVNAAGFLPRTNDQTTDISAMPIANEKMHATKIASTAITMATLMFRSTPRKTESTIVVMVAFCFEIR
jgi:hypothetical protein